MRNHTIEVLEDFVAAGLTEAPEDEALGVQWILLPPWRERLASGKLGPWFGPTSCQYAAQYDRYREGIAGGGLWDHSEDYPRECVSTMTGEVVASRQEIKKFRYDGDIMASFVERQSIHVPRRELEVYFLYWRDLLSRGVIARRLELAPASVQEYIDRLRNRMKKWRERRGQ